MGLDAAVYDGAACVVWMIPIEAMEEISRRLITVRIFGVWFWLGWFLVIFLCFFLCWVLVALTTI